MHEKIRRFQLTGTIVYGAIVSGREQWERVLLDDMRDQGYVPTLEHGPHFSVLYSERTQSFDCTLTMYGVFVGKKKAWEIEGITATGRRVPRIRQTKLSQFSSG